ncbi:MAG: hypothetical protein WCO63_04835 [Bacteroidota bacterium]
MGCRVGAKVLNFGTAFRSNALSVLLLKITPVTPRNEIINSFCTFFSINAEPAIVAKNARYFKESYLA